MGTLFDQPERDNCNVNRDQIEDLTEVAMELSKKLGVSVADVIAAARVCQLERANDLYVRNGDVFDEQMGGFGQLLQELIAEVRKLKESLTDSES